MATETKTPANVAHWSPYRLTVRQFEAMIKAGLFPEDAHVELLGGMLVDQMTRHHPHNFAVLSLSEQLREILPAPWLISEEKPVEIGRRWRPEPDLAVILGPTNRYRGRNVSKRDARLLIEVAYSSYAIDRGEKWRAYAAARIPCYWIVHLAKGQVEVYRDPAGSGKSAAYKSTEVFGVDASIPVEIDGQEVGRVALRDFMP